MERREMSVVFALSVPRESPVRLARTDTPVFPETWELMEKRESPDKKVSLDSKDFRDQL